MLAMEISALGTVQICDLQTPLVQLFVHGLADRGLSTAGCNAAPAALHEVATRSLAA